MNRHFLLCLFIFVYSCSAWYNEGHMIISDIAYQLSTDDVKTKIDALIAVLKEDYPDYQDHYTASVWADDIKKSEFPESGYWHFIKLPYVLDNVTYDSPYNTVNIINKIEELKNTFDILTYSKDQARSLYFLIHLLGDIHMPLHIGSLYSKQFIQSDNNGGLFTITVNNTKTSLHSYIDGGAGVYTHYYPLPISGQDRLDITNVATNLTQLCSFEYAFEPASWANETLSHLNYIYSNIKYEEKPSKEYEQHITNLTNYQFCIAGHRLAGLYKQILVDTDIPSDFYFVLFFGVSVFSLVVIDEYFNRHGVDLNSSVQKKEKVKTMKIVSSTQI